LQEDSLLLCDACDLGFHLECCRPALDRVPRGRWYCETCSRAGNNTESIFCSLFRAQILPNFFENFRCTIWHTEHVTHLPL
jgi:hypothetical protein